MNWNHLLALIVWAATKVSVLALLPSREAFVAVVYFRWVPGEELVCHQAPLLLTKEYASFNQMKSTSILYPSLCFLLAAS